MVVRSPVLPTDLPAMQGLWRVTWIDAYGPVLGPERLHLIDEAVAEPAVLSMFPADGGALVAEEADVMVGSVCFAERHGRGYVWGMYVLPGRQRRGIGSALLRAAARSMSRAETLDLSTVTPASAAFYRRLGFAEVGASDFELFPGILLPSTWLSVAADALRGGPTAPLTPPA